MMGIFQMREGGLLPLTDLEVEQEGMVTNTNKIVILQFFKLMASCHTYHSWYPMQSDRRHKALEDLSSMNCNHRLPTMIMFPL